MDKKKFTPVTIILLILLLIRLIGNFIIAIFFYFFAVIFAVGYLFALIGVAEKAKIGSILAAIIGIIDLIFAILL